MNSRRNRFLSTGVSAESSFRKIKASWRPARRRPARALPVNGLALILGTAMISNYLTVSGPRVNVHAFAPEFMNYDFEATV